MNKTLITVAGLALASPAFADLASGPQTNLLNPSQYSITATPIGAPDIAGVFGTAYSNMAAAAGYQAFPAATGAIGFDDYDSIGAPATSIDLSTFRFVGGVQQAAGTMFFDFYDTNSNFVDSFGVTLTNPGNFIYTITINTYPGGVVIPEAGLLQVTVGAGFTGQWFLNADAPTIGTSNSAIGGAAGGLQHKFELNGDYVVPAPASAALLGLGGLAAIRRRR